MKKCIENTVYVPIFKIDDAYKVVIDNLPSHVKATYIKAESRFNNKKKFKLVIRGLIRYSFLIELVNDEVTSTKFEVRWCEKLRNDPRYSTFDECLDIFIKLLNELSSTNNESIELVNDFVSINNAVPYELPLDYINITNKMHVKNNIKWLFNDNDVSETLELRKILLDKEKNSEYTLFKTIFDKKVKIKTYLTDRAQTGNHKTNREKRWEIHPDSVQFALRKDCLQIERLLLLQCCCFKNAPQDIIDTLINHKILNNNFNIHTCPITGDSLSFTDFKNDVINREQGKSKFHVGHLNPLKGIHSGSSYGHSSNNISWISEDGNRIQGSLSMSEVDELLIRIVKNRNLIK